MRQSAAALLFAAWLVGCLAPRPALADCPDASVRPGVRAADADWPIICHTGFALQHNNNLKVPLWVRYELNREQAFGCLERRDHYRPDPELGRASASLADYRGSGFTRGHNAPAGDMKWDMRALRESFYLSNMTPQQQELNNGPWELMEQIVRAWAAEHGAIVVVTGPIFASRNPERIRERPRGVAIPSNYFKVVYDPAASQSMTFIVPQGARGLPRLDEWTSNLATVRDTTGVEALPNTPGLTELTRPEDLWNFDLRAFRTERQRRCVDR